MPYTKPYREVKREGIDRKTRAGQRNRGKPETEEWQE